MSAHDEPQTKIQMAQIQQAISDVKRAFDDDYEAAVTGAPESLRQHYTSAVDVALGRLVEVSALRRASPETGWPAEDRELAVQLVIRFARGGNEHQLAKARELLGLSPFTFAPDHRCQFCEVPHA